METEHRSPVERSGGPQDIINIGTLLFGGDISTLDISRMTISRMGFNEKDFSVISWPAVLRIITILFVLFSVNALFLLNEILMALLSCQ